VGAARRDGCGAPFGGGTAGAPAGHLVTAARGTAFRLATYGVIGSGHKELTPRLVTNLAALLETDALELAALTGVFLSEMPASPTPQAVDAAAHLWEARRLPAAQARHVSEPSPVAMRLAPAWPAIPGPAGRHLARRRRGVSGTYASDNRNGSPLSS
jgi:hypothetical protein